MFSLLGLSLLGGIAIGLGGRGRFGNLRNLRFRWIPAVMASLFVALVPLFLSLPQGVKLAIQLTTMLGVSLFLLGNLVNAPPGVRAGLLVLALGWLLNFVVIAANGAMPLSLSAYERSGQQEALTPGEGGFFKIEVADSNTRLRLLADVIPIPPLRQVVSVGDLGLMIGVAMVLGAGMRQDIHSGHATS